MSARRKRRPRLMRWCSPWPTILVEHSDQNLPLAHRAGQLLRETSALIVTVAESPAPPEIDNTLPEPEAAAQKKAQKMAPVFNKPGL